MTPSPLPRRLAAAAVGSLAVLAVPAAAAYAAPGSVTISGTVRCANSHVDEVWVEARAGGSGEAATRANILDVSARGKSYSYVLPRGGAYRLIVTCSNNPFEGTVRAVTPVLYAVSGTRVVCGDMSLLWKAAGKRYPILSAIPGSDLSQGVEFEACETTQTR